MPVEFEQKKIVWSGVYKMLRFSAKMVNHFGQSVGVILEGVSVTETIKSLMLNY